MQKEFNRLLPEVITIVDNAHTRVMYDACDVPEELRTKIREQAKSENPKDVTPSSHIVKGEKIGRRFRIYDTFDGDIVGVTGATEYLDNPHGYGKNDFYFHKFVMPKYRKGYLPRIASYDIFYLMFKSYTADRIYSYVRTLSNAEELKEFFKIDHQNNLCMSMEPLYDGYNIQKYMRVEQLMDTEDGPFGILNMSGEVFRSIDLELYCMSSMTRHIKGWDYDRTLEVLRRHNQRLDKWVEEIKNESITCPDLRK